LVPKLIPLLNHPNIPLRIRVPWRLAEYRDVRALPALLASLDNAHTGILYAIGEIGDRSAISNLHALVDDVLGGDLESPVVFDRDRSGIENVPSALIALAKLGDHTRGALAGDLALAAVDEELRANAVRALSHVVFEGQWGVLEKLASDASDAIGCGVVEALYHLGSARAVPMLSRLASATTRVGAQAAARRDLVVGGAREVPEGVVLRGGVNVTLEWVVEQLTVPPRGVDALDEFVRITGLYMGSREQDYDADRWVAAAQAAVEEAGFHLPPGALYRYGTLRALPSA
jgi:hypothetical protein